MIEKITFYAIILSLMSVIFGKKGRKFMRVIFSALAVLIALSMVLLYAPGLVEFFV
jgi:hypothetical protein